MSLHKCQHALGTPSTRDGSLQGGQPADRASVEFTPKNVFIYSTRDGQRSEVREDTFTLACILQGRERAGG